ncbi:MAG: hypothetical protein BGO40_01335 [Chryseobacterium sp. 39-10]|nr:DUF1800 domain-containing protein [Chryseobacterium sp.]OJV46932.1 MAG: hypothetical protein BGO40_01335 [Chryseobacterium sp. 39-10]
MVDQLHKNKHLLWRAGFGPSLSQLINLEKIPTRDVLRDLFSKKSFSDIHFDTPAANIDYQTLSKTDAETRKQIQQLNRKQTLEINLNFFDQMVAADDQLREKMAFFWHGHFATRVVNAAFNQQMLGVIRKNALGNFRDLLFEVSRSPAMLQFLNNQQNVKNHPNENFAREVMELFTMGRGNYTEKDIREAARAFTGWAYQKDGTFIFKEKQHDQGDKTFLGKTGNFKGDDILNIILEQKATSRFIVAKLYRFFVNESLDEKIVDQLSSKFVNSNYDITALLHEIFSADWFYDQKNIGSKIKSPIELMVGIRRVLPMNIGDRQNLIQYQQLLGQMLLYPPNVAGWPSGKAWIDSSSLLLRMQLPQIWSGLRPMDYKAKENDDLDMGQKNRSALEKVYKNPKIDINWKQIEEVFAGKNIPDYLLQIQNRQNDKTISSFSDQSVKINIIDWMSTPEYQLC